MEIIGNYGSKISLYSDVYYKEPKKKYAFQK